LAALEKQCFDDLGQYDIVVCMQSIHEVRDKTLAVEIYKNIVNVIKPNGYFLVCDFVIGNPGIKDISMYMTEIEQKDALVQSGFTSPKLITNHLGLTLFTAQN
jgi:2-polyprenyl-3-methyl-5-hydroxy-6-metoxy-1,4-benzoquinol methylase